MIREYAQLLVNEPLFVHMEVDTKCTSLDNNIDLQELQSKQNFCRVIGHETFINQASLGGFSPVFGVRYLIKRQIKRYT